MPRLAVVLFNLGGPDDLRSVRPFLFNLFNDPAIIGAPRPLRWLLAHFIAARRAPTAGQIYAHIGGKSPLLDNTLAQAKALTAAVADIGDVRCFIAMRYWHPMSDETVRAVVDFRPDQVILLPLYPQFSTTTTGSSIRDWQRAAAAAGLRVPTRAVCCYPSEPGFIAAVAALTREGYQAASVKGPPRLLFSAHGLPKKVVTGGDPYQWQVERTAEAIVQALGIPELDWVVCYQSRVGPLQWIGPGTDAEIVRAGGEGRSVVVVPIAFVSEHSETLVELDIEYRHLAKEDGVPVYVRVRTVDTDAPFIDGLAGLVRRAAASTGSLCSGVGGRFCATGWRRCPFAGE
jgi:ferrochelatase